MKKYDIAAEKRTERMRAAREQEMNEWLLRRLHTHTKAESLREVYNALTFIVGTGTIHAGNAEKARVF